MSTTTKPTRTKTVQTPEIREAKKAFLKANSALTRISARMSGLKAEQTAARNALSTARERLIQLGAEPPRIARKTSGNGGSE